MNKLSIFLFIFISFVGFQNVFAQDDFNHPKETDYPNLLKSGESIDDFVPKGWETMGKACGDLNRDKAEDCALVISANDSKFLNRNKGLGSDIFNTNPGVLLVLFKAKDGYKAVKQSNSFIIPSDSPTMTEPFQTVEIKNGVLELSFELFFSAGSWGMTTATYKFKFLNGEFVLIGADKTDTMRNTGKIETRSYNFLTGKVKISTGNTSSDKDKVRWKTYKPEKMKTLETFKAPFSWEIEPNFSL